MSDVILQSGLTREEIEAIVENNTRYEISDDGSRIRAFHGHSIHVSYGDAVRPPDRLYHGTSMTAFDAIQCSGAILPMRRDKVHLTDSLEYATSVARRHRDPRGIAILEIDSKKMFDDGVIIHLSGDGVYLVNSVPIQYVSILDGADSPQSGSSF